MADLRILVEGPGGTLGAPILAIKEVLEAIGCIVRIEDKHPMTDDAARSAIQRGAFSRAHVVIEAKHWVLGG